MQHLTLDVLARLVDEEPTREEREHLAGCPTCVAELNALREQTLGLAHLGPTAPSVDLWPGIESRLRREGLIGGRGGAYALRAAAGLALFLVGSLAGGTAVRFLDGSPRAAVVTGAPAAPSDVAAAAAQLEEAEAAYLAAVVHYGELTGEATEVDAASRLAALEGILMTTGAALRTAPADPVINNYHLTALGLRDALMRQIRDVEGEEWY